MIVNVEVISENIYDNLKIDGDTFQNIQNEIEIKYLVQISNQEWFFNDKNINSSFNLISGNYTVYFSVNYISLTINNKNKITKLPFLSPKLKIQELKNILSIKDNIYLNNELLLNNKKISDYNISSNDILKVKNNFQII